MEKIRHYYTEIEAFSSSIPKSNSIKLLNFKPYQEIGAEYFKKIALSKKYKKVKLKYVNPNSLDFKNFTIVQAIRQKFSLLTSITPEKVCRYFVKIKHCSNEVKFLELTSEPRLDIPMEEFNVKHSLATSLEENFWGTAWRQGNHERAYQSIECSLASHIQSYFEEKLYDEGESLSILEIGAGEGALAEELLTTFTEEIAHYWHVELDQSSSQKAQKRLEGNPHVSFHQENIMTADFTEFFKNKTPSILIASGILTEQVLDSAEDAKIVLKKLIPHVKMFYLTGRTPLLVSISELRKIYPFNEIKKVDYSAPFDFLVLEKKEIQEDFFKVQRNGTLDLYCMFEKNPHMSLSKLLQRYPQDLSRISVLDLSVCSLQPGDLSSLSFLPNLEDLRLGAVKGLNEHLLDIPEEVLQTLRKLDVSVSDVSEETLKKILPHCKLSQLRLDHCSQIPIPDQIRLMLQYGQKDSILDLSFVNRRNYKDQLSFTLEILNEHSKPNYKKIKIPISAITNNNFNLVENISKKGLHVQVITDYEMVQTECLTVKEIVEKTNQVNVALEEKYVYSHEFDQIKHYLQKPGNLLEFVKFQSVLITQQRSGLRYALQMTPAGDCYILLKTKVIPLLGQGEQKKVKYAMHLENRSLAASFTIPMGGNGELFNILTTMQNEPELEGVVKVLACSSFYSKKKESDKIHVLSELYSDGSYLQFAAKESLSIPQRMEISSTIFKGALNLSKLGYCHLDIHLDNVFIRQREGQIEAAIGDLDSLCLKSHDLFNINSERLNASRVSPEFWEQQLQLESGVKVSIDVEKMMVWMIGLTLADIFKIPVPFLAEIEKLLKNGFKKELMNKALEIMHTMPFQASLGHDNLNFLLAQMLEIDPDKRISLVDAAEKFKIMGSSFED